MMLLRAQRFAAPLANAHRALRGAARGGPAAGALDRVCCAVAAPNSTSSTSSSTSTGWLSRRRRYRLRGGSSGSPQQLPRAAGDDAAAAASGPGDDDALARASAGTCGASSAPSSVGAARAALDACARALAAPSEAYARALRARPLLTKACTSLVGFAVGDAIAQSIGSPPGAALDGARVARLALYGLLVDGPLGALWYDWLEANVRPERPREAKTVLIKTALDQVVYASVGTVLFFTVVTLLEGRPAAVPAVVAAKFWPTLVANYAIWPLAHLVNFRFVPPAYRIAYNNVVAVGWLALLSLITHAHHAGGGAGLLAAVMAQVAHACGLGGGGA